MLENTEAWEKEVTISLPTTIPGTQDRFCKALREELTKKNHDFEQDFLSALRDETGRDWTEPFPVEIWQFETESGHEINVNSDEDASSVYNYISASDAQLWELLSAGLRGVLRVYFKDGPNEINVLEIRLLITLQREDALPEVTFICQQESVEHVTLLVSCGQKRAKRIRVPSCISSDDLAAFLKDVFGVASGTLTRLTLKTPETEAGKQVLIQPLMPLYRYLSWSGAEPTEMSTAESDLGLASAFEELRMS